MDPSGGLKPAISPNAPSAARPGMGQGNIPFAPGMATGRFAGPTTPPQRQIGPPPSAQMGPPPAPSGPGANLGGPPQGPPGMPGMGGSPMSGAADPQFWLESVNAYVNALVQAVSSGKGGLW